MTFFVLFCFSLFIMSNESINTWSHLAGFVYFFLLMLYDNFVLIPRKGGTFQDHAIFTIFLIGYQICMFCSAGYHLFCCHSEKVFHQWLALDLAGVSIGLCVCYIPSVFYAYHCFKVRCELIHHLIKIHLVTILIEYFASNNIDNTIFNV